MWNNALAQISKRSHKRAMHLFIFLSARQAMLPDFASVCFSQVLYNVQVGLRSFERVAKKEWQLSNR